MSDDRGPYRGDFARPPRLFKVGDIVSAKIDLKPWNSNVTIAPAGTTNIEVVYVSKEPDSHSVWIKIPGDETHHQVWESDLEQTLKMPWGKPTPQVKGRKSEKILAKKYDARLHPNSGAGHIKWDMSTDEDLIEAKDAAKTHTVKGELLEQLFLSAVRQDRNARYIITFGNGIVLDGFVRKE